MRRWLIIILTFVLVFVAAVAIVVQIVLHTDIPRRVVLNILEQETGLRVQASSLQSSWGGMTTLNDLRIGLPLESDPFLTVPHIRISHTDLLRLVLLRDLAINVAYIDQPHITLRQDDEGRWNILDALAIIEQRQANRQITPGEIPALPQLTVNEARIEIFSMSGREVPYGPVTIQGDPSDALAWAFSVQYMDDVIAEGRLAPRSNWAHRINFDFQNIQQLVAPWLDEQPPVLLAAGQWRGRVDGTSLTGTLSLNPLRADVFTLEGDTAITVTGPLITLEPIDLTLAMDDPDMPSMALAGGMLRLDAENQQLHLHRVIVAALDTRAQVDGGWILDDDTGWLDVKWSGRLEALAARHEGAMTVRLDMPRVGWHALTATVQSTGTMPEATWDSQWVISGRGYGWRDFTGSIHAQRLNIITEDETIDLAGFAARATSDWPVLKLTHLTMPGATTKGRGQYDMESHNWDAVLSFKQWDIPGLTAPTVDIFAQLHGDAEQLHIDRLSIIDPSEHGFTFTAGGLYAFGDSQPLYLRAQLETEIDDEDLSAALLADFSIMGILQPLDLHIEGELDATTVAWENRAVEDLRIPLRGSVQPDHAAFESPEFSLLGGVWRVAGRYDFASQYLHASVAGLEADIARIMALLDAPLELEGLFSTEVQLEVPQRDAAQASIVGSWTLTNLAGEGLLEAASGQGRIALRDDRVELSDMQLSQNEGALTGMVSMNLQDTRFVDVDAVLDQWHIVFDAYDTEAWVSGSTSLRVDIIDLLADGDLDVRTRVLRHDELLVEADVDASVQGRVAQLKRFNASAFGGTAEGSGVLYLTTDRWTQSTVDASWQDIDLSLLPIDIELDHSLQGIVTGTLQLEKSEDPRAPEPMRLTIKSTLSDASYGPITLGDAEMVGYLGPRRLMIQRSRLAALDGGIELWGRITQHDGEPFAHVGVTLDMLDLQQIADFLEMADDQTPGRISGEANVGGYFSYPYRLFGSSTLELTQSDIASLPGIAQLYNFFNIDFGAPEPTGRGEVLLRLENNTLDVARMTYFNRGMDVIARVRVEDIWAGSDSPISGLALGTVRPLRDTSLPFIGDNLDRLISAIQADAATVRINGTRGEPQAALVPLEEVTGAVRRLIRGTVD
jgi:hypothetical protein